MSEDRTALYYFVFLVFAILLAIYYFFDARYFNPDNYSSEYQYGEERVEGELYAP